MIKFFMGTSSDLAKQYFGERRLREDKLLVVLSGLRMSRQSNLRANTRKIFVMEEHPKEGEPHESVRDMHFTDSYGSPTENFDLAFSGLTQSSYIEHVGHGGDYIVYQSLVRRAEEIRQEHKIPEEHYEYLHSLGERIEDLAW